MRRRRSDAFALTVTTVVLTLVQALAWVIVLQGQLHDAALAAARSLTTALPLLALALMLLARRRSRHAREPNPS